MKKRLLALLLALAMCLCLLPTAASAAEEVTEGDFVFYDTYEGAVLTQRVLAKYNGQDKDVVIPDGVTSIGNWAFNKNKSLHNVTIPNSVTSIGDGAFYACTALTSITIPGSVATIGNNAFTCCKRLTSVDIGSGVTQIGSQAFLLCINLVSVTVPASVTKIGKSAFPRPGNSGRVTGELADIVGKTFTYDPDLVIYGEAGSYVETYAKEYHVPFVATSGTPAVQPEMVTVTLHTEMGDMQVTTEKGKPMAVPANPTKEGHTFAGWYTDEALTIPYNFDSVAVGNIVLYAKWNVISSTDKTTAQSTQTVTLNGKAVKLQGYTLKAANGGDVTYVKLRDVAALLDGTSAQFNVDWRNGAIYVVGGAPYTSRNGTELEAITVLDSGFQWNTAPVLFDGVADALEGIVITDVSSGGHTFFKLRDLGAAIGFQVDWSAEKGIYIETK